MRTRATRTGAAAPTSQDSANDNSYFLVVTSRRLPIYTAGRAWPGGVAGAVCVMVDGKGVVAGGRCAAHLPAQRTNSDTTLCSPMLLWVKVALRNYGEAPSWPAQAMPRETLRTTEAPMRSSKGDRPPLPQKLGKAYVGQSLCTCL
jgi:hypothetical protein